MLNRIVTLDVTIVTHAKHVRSGNGILHFTKQTQYVLVVLKHYTRAMYVTNKKAKMLSRLYCIRMLNATVTLDATSVTHAKHAKSGRGMIGSTRKVRFA